MNGDGFSDGDFTMIASDVNDPDDGKLYVWNGTGFTYIADLSGSQGIKGDTGEKGDPGEKGETGEQGLSAYQVAVNAGFSGSVKQWLDSLVGTVDNAGLTTAPAFVNLQTQVNDSAVGTNLIVAKTIKNRTTLYDSGTNAGYLLGFLTDYIPVVANQKYTITIYGTTNSCLSRIAYYDSSKNFISRERDLRISTSSSEVIVIPSGASYIIFSPDTPDQSGEYKNNFKIEKGSVATDWSPNPSDILTQADYAKIQAAIVALGGSLS